MRFRTISAVLLVLLPALAAAGLAPGAKPISVTDVAGARHRIPDADKPATVLLFIARDCPISNGYAPEINRICAEYSPRRIGFYIVYAEPDLTPAEARKHTTAYGYRCPALLDTANRLVRLTGATITPEAAVLAPDGKLLYRGRIDDLYVELGTRRYQPTVHDLRAALDAILQGKPVPNPTTRAVGCFIPK
jgi:hypothetical protein